MVINNAAFLDGRMCFVSANVRTMLHVPWCVFNRANFENQQLLCSSFPHSHTHTMSKQGQASSGSRGRAAGSPFEKANQVLTAANTRSYVSQSGLSAVLKSVRDNGLPDALSRSAVKRARERALPESLWTNIELELDDGTLKCFPVIDPVQLLKFMLEEIPSFADYFEGQLSKHPCSDAAPWTICMYADEVLPGNALKPRNDRKFIAFYWSLVQFDAGCAQEALWFHVGCLRSNRMASVKSGWAQYFKKATALFFTSPFNLALGTMVHLRGHGDRMFFAKLGLVIADEPALKSIWGSKGASGNMPCFFCQNVALHSSDLAKNDATNFLVPHTCTDATRFVQHTDASVMEAARYLQRTVGTVNKATFTRHEQAVGLNHCPEGPLLSNDFLRHLINGPISSTQMDWMHIYLVGGIFQTECTHLLGALKGVVSAQDIHRFLGNFCFPKSLSSRAVTGQKMFSKVDQDVKSSASEGLSVYPLIRCMLVHEVPDGLSPEIDIAKNSFFALAQVLDLLKRLITGTVTPSDLRQSIHTHMALRLKAYGEAGFQPKCHYCAHLPDFMERQPLMNCFVHERKHKELKRFGNDFANANRSDSFEKHLLLQVCLQQVNSLKDLKQFHGVHMDNPFVATKETTQYVKTAFNLNPMLPLAVEMSNQVFVRPGLSCSAKDVVLVQTESGQYVGEVWFHVKIGAQSQFFTLWSPWSALGNNRFQVCDEPEFVETESIQACLVHRKDPDGSALVAP